MDKSHFVEITNQELIEEADKMVKIKELSRKQLNTALPLIWNVFLEYEGVNYPESGKQAFWDAIHSEEYLAMLRVYGAFEDKELLGVIATRNEGSHVALFFVKGEYHRKGIGRSLWNAVLSENTSETITVHSSLFAVPIYKNLGFIQTDDAHEEGGIQYVPMKYQMIAHNKRGCKKTALK